MSKIDFSISAQDFEKSCDYVLSFDQPNEVVASDTKAVIDGLKNYASAMLVKNGDFYWSNIRAHLHGYDVTPDAIDRPKDWRIPESLGRDGSRATRAFVLRNVLVLLISWYSMKFDWGVELTSLTRSAPKS